MANTLKFGNGEWYGKKDTILAYNDENSNYKPLPFDFARDSTGTRVNKDGLIETVGSGEPRIDYLDNTAGSLLLEPQRTNLITQSEAFDNVYWTKSGSSVVGGFASPSADSPLGAFKLVEDTSTGFHRVYSINALTPATFSFYAKKGERRYIQIGAGNTGSLGITAIFDLQLGVVSGIAVGDAKIEFIGNEWYRCSISGVGTGGATSLNLYLCNGGTVNSSYTYTGDGTSGVYIYGAQLEEGSYPTSYIKTEGSIATRLVDSCSNGGNDQVINSTEGVLYAEISALADDLTNRHIGISDNTNANRLQIFFNAEPTTQVRTLNLVNSVKYFDMLSNVTLINGYVKVAVKYKENDFALWINGVEVATDNSGLVWSNGTLDTLKFSDGAGASPFYGNVKDVRVYDTALTDAELQALTSK